MVAYYFLHVVFNKLKGARTPPTQFFVDGCYARLLLLYTSGASLLQHKDKVPAEGAAH